MINARYIYYFIINIIIIGNNYPDVQIVARGAFDDNRIRCVVHFQSDDHEYE